MSEVSSTLDRELLAEPVRQSPIAVVFIAGRFIRNLGSVNLGVAILFLISGRLSGALLGIGVLASGVLLVATLLAWWRFVFSVNGGELLVAKGVVAQERLTIPLDRIQSVSIDQKFLHRLVGLVAVKVDTAGSSAAEFEIQAVDRRRAEALQRLAAGEHPVGMADGAMVRGTVEGAGVVPAPVREDHLVVRTPIQLLKIGVSRWPWAGLVALAPLAAFAGDYADRLPIDVIEERVIEDNLPADLGAAAVATLVAIGLGVIVLGAVLGTVLQATRTLITDWDLRLTRTTTGFRRTAGLLSKTSKASTVNRIQAVQVDETPIERLFGIRRVTLPTIGEGDLGIAGVTPDELGRIRREVFGPSTAEPVLDRMISPAYVFLAVRNQLLFALAAMALLAINFGWPAAAVLVVVPLRWWAARRRWRLWRWGITADRVGERYEVVNRHEAEIELIKTQTVEVTRSFFQRRRGLATVRIVNAEGFLEVPYISEAEAEAVRDRALHRVESDHRAWM